MSKESSRLSGAENDDLYGRDRLEVWCFGIYVITIKKV